jgi:hypothetical protein
MDGVANVSRIARGFRSFGSRAAAWVAESLTRSGGGKAALWQSYAQQHHPHPITGTSSLDRSDLRSMKANHQFGPADL